MRCVGIRGAITVPSNTVEAILQGTRELLEAMARANQVKQQDIAACFLTTTQDLNAEFPAVAARQLGWTDTALLCGHEMAVPGSLGKCVRVLLLVNSNKKKNHIVHTYLRGASALRPPEEVTGTAPRRRAAQRRKAKA